MGWCAGEASPDWDKVVFWHSFSFIEDFYRALNRTLHKTTSEPPASHQIWQLAGGCTHTNMCTGTHRRQVPQFPFPRKQAWSQLIYSLAVLDASGGSIRVREDGEYQSMWQLANLWGWMGQDVRRAWISSHLPTKNIVYLHPYSGKRWSEASNLVLDF